MSSKKEERYYQTLAKDIQECIEQKRSLNEFYKDDLSFYCYKKGIVANGERKADLIDAIVADINGDTSVGNADEQSKTTQKTKDKNAITFDDIAGLERAKESFREKVILPFEHPELYKKFGKKQVAEFSFTACRAQEKQCLQKRRQMKSMPCFCR